MRLRLIGGRLQLWIYVTSGNVTLTSDPLLTTSDLVNADDDETPCLFRVDIIIDPNHVIFTGSIHSYTAGTTTTTTSLLVLLQLLLLL